MGGKLGLVQEKYTKEDMQGESGKDFRACIEKITVPITCFCAIPGSLFSPELAKWVREHAAAPYRSAAFENSTHMPVSERPEQLARKVVQILTDRKTQGRLSRC